MENKIKRFLSLLLAFTMVLSYVPVQVFADDTLCEHGYEAAVCETCSADPAPQNEEEETPENPVTPETPENPETPETPEETPETDALVAQVQAMINALRTTFNEGEAAAAYAEYEAVTAAIAALTEEQRAQLDLTNYYAAANPTVIPNEPNGPNVAKIGDAEYESLADAAAAAQAGNEIVMLADVTEDVTLPAGVTFNGNGKQVGVITAAGEVTFKGHTKATSFGVQYVNTTINIVEGACLEITGTGRLVIGHGCTFNITGTITDAKTANVADLTASLIMPGASFTGAGVTFNATNAYIKVPSSYSSTSKTASGTFDFNITNSIWESAGKLAFEAQSTAATVNFELKDSVLNTGNHLVFGVSKGEVVIDNSKVNEGKSYQLENRSTMTIKNGSVVNGAVATSSNAINPGTIIVDNATYAVTGEFSGANEGTGTIIVKSGANVSAGSITNANIQIDATGMEAGAEINLTANLSKFAGQLEVVNNDKLEAKIVDGKVVLAERQLNGSGTEADPYTIGSLEELKLFANKANAGNNYAGKYVKLTADIDLANEAWTPIKKFNGTFDGDNHKISNVNVVGTGNMGFFAEVADQTEHVTGTVKNVTFDNVTIISESGNGNAGPIANAKLGARITNVKVTGTVNIKGYCGVGGIVGAGFPVLDSCSVEAEGTITATYWGVGGILGFASDKGAKATNSTVVSTGNGLTIHGELGGVGAVTGTPHGAATKNATVTGVEITSNNNYYMGYVDASGTISGKVTVTDVAVKVNGEEIIGNDALVTINNTPYFSLQDAANNVKDGDIIVLQSNITFNEDAYFDNGGWKDGAGFVTDKNFTIDLNNYTIGQNGHLNDYLLFFKNNGTKANEITIKNGTLDAGTTAYCAICTSTSNAQQITINLENVNLINNNSNGAVAKIRGGSVLNVKAGTVITGKDSYVGIEAVGDKTVVNIYEGAVIKQKGTTNYVGSLAGVSYGATLNVYGGSGVSAKGGFIAMTSGGTINISGGEWTANNDGTPANGNNSVLIAQSDKNTYTDAGDSIVNVTGGTFKGGYNCYGAAAGDAQLNISGGKFNADPKAYVVEDYEVNGENGEYTVVETAKAVAINGKGYRTLSAAITAAKAGDTITFMADITEDVTINKAVTIDGAGKTYTGTMKTTDAIELTVQNVNFVKGSIDANTSAQGRKLTVKNCTFDGVDKSIGYAITVRHGDSVVIENSSAKNYKTGMLYIPQSVTAITVKGVTVENVAAAFNISYSGDALFEEVAFENVTYGIHFQIYGSRTYTVKNSDLSGATNPFWFWDKSNKTEKVTVVFEGNNTVPSFQEIGYTTSGILKLAEGATLTAPEGITVTTDVDKMKVEYKSGVYQLVKASVAKIGNVEYATLQEAVDAANAGATIVLIEDAEGAGVVIDKDLTIDFAGKIYTLTKGVGSTGTESNGFQILKGNTVRLQGGTLQVAESAKNEFYILIQNYANLTVYNMTLDGTNLDKYSGSDGDSYTLSNNCGSIAINKSTVKANDEGDLAFAFDVCDQTAKGYELPVVTVYPSSVIEGKIEAAAKVGNSYYATLAHTLENAAAGKTITLQGNTSGAGLVIDKNTIIDFNGCTYTLTEPVGSTGTESNGFQILKGNTVTLRNGTLKVAPEAADKFYILIQNYANLTVNNMTLDGTNLDKWSKTDGDSYTLSNNSGKVTIGANTKIIANNDGALAFAFDACDKSAWGYELPVVTVNKTAVIEGNIEAAAKIGNVYYANLNQALEAATNNQTVTLMSNIKANWNDVVKTTDGYTALFKVEGKSITLDLNGKTISVDHQSTTDRIYAVVCVEDGASLKVTGNGGIDVKTDADAPKVAYMFWKRGTTGNMTIENGTYHMNNSEDSMVYTNGNDIVNVTGGTWTLDAIGTRVNRFPCIFNAQGNNVRHINVSGGTYNFNVNAQYWAHEVDVVDAKGNLSYVIDNGNGTWTVTGNTAEAAIMTDVAGSYDYPIGYATLADALAAAKAGQPVLLMKDITLETSVAIAGNRNVVIDLNGHTLSSAKAHVVTCYYSKTTITIKDSVGGGKVLTNGSGKHAFVVQSNLVIDGAEISSIKGGNAIVAQTANANVTIQNDAVINGKVVVKAGKLTVTGGTFNDKLEITAGVTVEISGGYFKYPVKAEWCAEGYIPTEKLENGYFSVMKDPANGMTAKVVGENGTTYHETLAAAIAAAEDGATIQVLADIDIGEIDPVKLDGKYNTYFKVEGKSVTIDLSGKTISGEYTGSNMLVGVFSTDNNGHMTLTGNGTVNVTTGEGATVYSLIVNYEDGCSIIVENGTYTLDAASDSLMYSGSNEGITVEGGNFHLGNVGTGKNGMPWIFNVKGQNDRHVIVKGGSFNADILHQYYPFEVQMSETLALKNENGIYTVDDAVAYVTEREWSSKWYTNNVGYATLEEAIAHCDGPKTKTSGKKTYTSDPEEVHIVNAANIEAIEIPAGFEGKLVLDDINLNYIAAAEKANIEITGNVKVENANGSAITGKVLNITGKGNLTAIAGNVVGAFGIGGLNTESITIEDVHIDDVKGGFVQPLFVNDEKYGKSEPEGGAAIGSGYNGAVISLTNVTIDNAQGGSKAAGIGARYHTGVTINITGSTIKNVEGGNASAGIGGSRVSSGAAENGTIINIKDSTITAKGGQAGAGIGSGYDTHCLSKQPLCTINIDGSNINAIGGKYAAGVGTGYHNAALAGEIKNSSVTAVSGEKFYKGTYTQAQDIGFGVVDPAREGQQTESKLIYNDTAIGIPAVQ